MYIVLQIPWIMIFFEVPDSVIMKRLFHLHLG